MIEQSQKLYELVVGLSCSITQGYDMAIMSIMYELCLLELMQLHYDYSYTFIFGNTHNIFGVYFCFENIPVD